MGVHVDNWVTTPGGTTTARPTLCIPAPAPCQADSFQLPGMACTLAQPKSLAILRSCPERAACAAAMLTWPCIPFHPHLPWLLLAPCRLSARQPFVTQPHLLQQQRRLQQHQRRLQQHQRRLQQHQRRQQLLQQQQQKGQGYKSRVSNGAARRRSTYHSVSIPWAITKHICTQAGKRVPSL